MQTCPGKERQSSNYLKNVGRLQKEIKTEQAKKGKYYHRNVIKIYVVVNIEDHEEQDMEISEKEDDTACNSYRPLWKTYTKKETWQHMYVVCSKCVPADTDLDHNFKLFLMFSLMFRDKLLFM